MAPPTTTTQAITDNTPKTLANTTTEHKGAPEVSKSASRIQVVTVPIPHHSKTETRSKTRNIHAASFQKFPSTRQFKSFWCGTGMTLNFPMHRDKDEDDTAGKTDTEAVPEAAAETDTEPEVNIRGGGKASERWYEEDDANTECCCGIM